MMELYLHTSICIHGLVLIKHRDSFAFNLFRVHAYEQAVFKTKLPPRRI
jgi:hypothetical protein